ncbi:uncharacterized protein LOC127249848 [Andrographis paniculata]|uniref:uncharacterized protein LOC127249848 n=1 Tax=Andrographis paniculata TaxID=175694 RepID=UPI0021E8126E|nr:uncharacterized protein LOC127249848 [Andrographis paniculata]
MKETIRCCIACILPCGSLDVIRIVHSNGHVEEIRGSVRAAEIMKLHPKHVLKKPPSSSPSDNGVCPKIVVLPPDAELQRGKIYFLIPRPPSPEKPRSKPRSSPSSKRKKKSDQSAAAGGGGDGGNDISVANLLISDRYLSEILSEKVSTHQRDRRRGRAAVWRPHLESISETTPPTSEA